MARIKKYDSSAERQAAYRTRRKEAGFKTSGASNIDRLQEWKERNNRRYKESKRTKNEIYRNYKKENRMFIALDGEGVTDYTDCYLYVSGNGKKQKQKQVPRHDYVLLSSSTGDYLENYAQGLSTEECLEFFLDLSKEYSGAIFTWFYGNYDVNMILRDLSEDEARKLWVEGELEIEGYKITWLPSKVFGVQKDGVSFISYDVSGFFQKSFIKALEDNKIEVPQEIIKGKDDRKIFNELSKTKKGREEIRKYNLLECQLLVELMNKLRGQMIECGFLPDKWHGAGAIASTIFSRYRIADFNYTPEGYKKEIVSAYFGGRNQMLQMGELGDVFIHDINSAYPAAMRDLPTARGNWIEQKPQSKIYQWGLHYIKWNVKGNLTPFPFRSRTNRIYWTKEGEGWYWSPEVQAAIDSYGRKQVQVLRTIQFYPESEEKPFDFINELYRQRQYLVSIGSDAQIPLKLGLNSFYGKCAQGIGYRGHRPKFQNYFWAGYITSQTRATMFRLAMTKPNEIVFFATDGVVSKSKLVESDAGKPLGGWDVKELANFFALQSGVYCFDSDKRKYKSRGFNYKSVDYDEVRKMWARKGIYGEYQYKETRFIGLGIALATDFNLWRRWQEQERQLKFMPVGEFKDYSFKQKWLSIPILPPSLEEMISQSYKPKCDWYETENDKEYISLLDQPEGYGQLDNV